MSCREVLEAHHRTDRRPSTRLNAIVTRTDDLARNSVPTILTESPTAVGRSPVCRSRTRICCPPRAFARPMDLRSTPSTCLEVDALIVERMRAAGAVVVGKTNAPEFGAGSQTFNRVFGATRNPYDTTKTCGGSSGGAAVALAARMIPSRGRQRHRGIAAQPGGVLQRHRLPPVARAGSVVSGRSVVGPVDGRPHGAHGGRCGAALLRARRTGPAGTELPA